MVFSSSLFVYYFLPITLVIYFIIFKFNLKYSNYWLLIVSLLFYSWGEPNYVILMLVSIMFNYLFGLFLEKTRNNDNKKVQAKLVLALSVLFNIGLLIYFKYTDFIIVSLNSLMGMLNSGFAIEPPQVILPIGISFFTFQIMSYVIDVYRGEVQVQKNIFLLGLYISLFPQLIAGPIVRYIDIEKEINIRTVSLEKFTMGMRRFIIGFIKKIIVANTVSVLADKAFGASLSDMTATLAWVGAISYAMQIYFDFSAYSDMAIGIGKMLGFDFKENFNYPYISKSMKDFWRRWHISLSTWFRDYLYVPLGGNRKGPFRTYRNLLIVFFITGLWHGASWSFIIWGLYHGLFLILERGAFGRMLEKIPSFFTRIYTLLIILIGWVIFRADSIGQALWYVGKMFDFSNIGFGYTVSLFDSQLLLITVLGIVFCMPVFKWLSKKFSWLDINQAPIGIYAVSNAAFVALFLVALCFMAANSGYNPFIYFRF